MCVIRHAAHAMFGDRVPSNEERVLWHQTRKLRRKAKWANRLSKDTAATRMVNQVALQMAVAYETIREQRYRRLVVMYSEKRNERKAGKYLCRAECSRAVINQLQQQLLAYLPLPQPHMSVDSPHYSTYTAVAPQQHQSPAAVAAMPVTMQSAAENQPQHAPPAYPGPVFAHYPTVSQLHSAASSSSSSSTPTSASSSSSHYYSQSSSRQLQEPWLKQSEQQTVY